MLIVGVHSERENNINMAEESSTYNPAYSSGRFFTSISRIDTSSGFRVISPRSKGRCAKIHQRDKQQNSNKHHRFMKSNRTTTYLLISLLWFLLLLFSHISNASTPTTKHALPTNNNKNNNNIDLLHVSTALNSTTPNNETTNNSNSTSPSNQQQNCSAVPSLYQQPSFSGHAMNLNDTSALNTTTAYQITLVPLSNSGEVDPTIQFLTLCSIPLTTIHGNIASSQ